MKKIMGLDYGDRRIGVAISDAFGWTAQGVEVIERRRDEGELTELPHSLKITRSVKSWSACLKI